MVVTKERTYGLASFVFYFILGLLMVVIPYETLKDMVFVFIGIIITLTSIIPTIYFWYLANEDKNYYAHAIISTISLTAGIIIIFWHNAIVGIILGVLLVVLPILRIIFSDNKWNEFKRQIPYFVIAILLFFMPASEILEVVFKVFGGVLMGLSVIGIILLVIAARKQINEYDDNDDINNNNGPKINKDDLIDVEVKEL